MKNCDHLGKVLALLSVDLVREKHVGGQERWTWLMVDVAE